MFFLDRAGPDRKPPVADRTPFAHCRDYGKQRHSPSRTRTGGAAGCAPVPPPARPGRHAGGGPPSPCPGRPAHHARDGAANRQPRTGREPDGCDRAEADPRAAFCAARGGPCLRGRDRADHARGDQHAPKRTTAHPISPSISRSQARAATRSPENSTGSCGRWVRMPGFACPTALHCVRGAETREIRNTCASRGPSRSATRTGPRSACAPISGMCGR